MDGMIRRRVLRLTGLGAVSALSGCLGDVDGNENPGEGTDDEGGAVGETETNDNDGSITDSEPTDVERNFDIPIGEGCPDGLTADDTTSGPSEIWIDPSEEPALYDGPLFLCHEHLYLPSPEPAWNWEMREECLSWYLEFVDRNDVTDVIPFIAPHQRSLFEEYPDSFRPFLSGPFEASLVGETPISDWPQIYDALLSEDDSWDGIGELLLYFVDRETESVPDNYLQNPPAKPILPDHPIFEEIYQVAATHDVTVMLHPYQLFQLDEAHRSNPLESPEILALERAFEAHRETTFLVHGLLPVGEWISDLLERHPNWYYDFSAHVPHGWSEPGTVGAPVDYGTHMTPAHIDEHARELYDEWSPIIEQVPDRVVIGFDTALPWHLDDRVLDTWVRMFRGVLGQLPEEMSENVGHRNATRMIES